MSKNEILNRVLSGLMEIPLPKDGKTIGIGIYKKEIEHAFKLARVVQFSDSLKEMKSSYYEFKKYIDSIK